MTTKCIQIEFFEAGPVEISYFRDDVQIGKVIKLDKPTKAMRELWMRSPFSGLKQKESVDVDHKGEVNVDATAIGQFKDKAGKIIRVIPKKGEAKTDAIDRVARDHGLNAKDIMPISSSSQDTNDSVGKREGGNK